MSWQLQYLAETTEDFDSLDGSQKILVRKAIKKTGENPLPKAEGGYGAPLGNKGSRDLTNFLKIKIRKAGIRIVYKLIQTETVMLVVVIGLREDEDVYEVALKRAEKYGL